MVVMAVVVLVEAAEAARKLECACSSRSAPQDLLCSTTALSRHQGCDSSFHPNLRLGMPQACRYGCAVSAVPTLGMCTH